MARPYSTYNVDDVLSPTDREEFSIFLRYPEIDFDTVDDCSRTHPPATLISSSTGQVESSPLSTTLSANHGDASHMTDTTAHTTPDRPLTGKHQVDCGGWNEFIYLMQKSRLPQECLQYLTSLGQTILNIGTILHSTLRPNQPSCILRIGQWLLSSIEYSSHQVGNQVEAIERLKLLVAFNVKPEEPQLWSIYRQRAKLIAKNTALPSKNELSLLKSLVSLYNAYVYRPFLEICSDNHFDKQTTRMVNEVYDRLMIWLQEYKLWCKGMTHLRTEYMQPLFDQLSQSENAKNEMRDFQQRIQKAKAVQGRSTDTGLNLMDEQVVKNLNLSARRPGPETALKRLKTRYKREHTL